MGRWTFPINPPTQTPRKIDTGASGRIAATPGDAKAILGPIAGTPKANGSKAGDREKKALKNDLWQEFPKVRQKRQIHSLVSD